MECSNRLPSFGRFDWVSGPFWAKKGCFGAQNAQLDMWLQVQSLRAKGIEEQSTEQAKHGKELLIPLVPNTPHFSCNSCSHD